ncbi:unnamed protein product [Urochloa decumbens]|uniref:Homeobox domain-containing protein n=1 Tax=Urochloa decumbens TaxID=240449 RepID=A0ABC9B1K0_9POAL
MAAYYHGGAGTDIQASTDGLQTLYLMNPSFAGYDDAGGASPPGPTNMMLLNSAVSTMTPASFGAHHHQQSPPAAQQHFVGIPLQAPPSGYNLWAPATSAAAAADMSPPQAQTPGAGGVSAVLSLSSREAPPPVTVAAVGGGADEGKYHLVGPSATSQGQMVMSSKYLKAAQELLDEVVSVSKGVEDAKAKSLSAVKKKEDSEGVSGGGTTEDGGGAAAPELSTAERQELQMKKSKLINMLDEVEQRYRQYHGQMQAVSSSFEAAAGAGSARTYTALALRTISRQFRCLRDAIAGQVRAASRALGEDADAAVAAAGGGRTVGSRLRYIDHQLRQQRALQQLGMMQGGAWRPQRGLPERSVSILRAWLFEHFLHPYPKDSDKIMLAKQTGLTRSQVSNWFINARVRLWKPMVEEMYLEETKDQDGGAGNDDGKSGGVTKSGDTSNGADGVITPRSTNGGAAMSKQAVEGASSAKQGVAAGVHHHGSTLLELAGDHHTAHAAGFYQDDGDDDVERRLKKARGDDQPAAAAFHGHHHVHDMAALHAQAAAAARQQHEEVSHRELLMKFMESGGGGAGAARDHHQDGGAYSFFAPGPYGQFGSEPFAFSGNGGVSLTLGLPHGAGGGAEQTASFLMGSSAGAGDSGGHGSSAGGYDMNMQSTKSFAAQLMRDFVA